MTVNFLPEPHQSGFFSLESGGGRVVSPSPPAGLLPEFCHSPSVLPTLTFARGYWGLESIPLRGIGEVVRLVPDLAVSGGDRNPSSCWLGRLPSGTLAPHFMALSWSLTSLLCISGVLGEKVGTIGPEAGQLIQVSKALISAPKCFTPSIPPHFWILRRF